MKDNEATINWGRVLIFFAIALVLSNIFRFDVFYLRPRLETLPPWLFVFISVLLEGSGVLLGALIGLRLLKKERPTRMSLYGTSKSYAVIMAIIPIVLLVVIGVRNDYHMNNHLYGLIAIIGTMLYCIMEEYGWRGYLQEELKPLPDSTKYLIIGVLWYVWHLTFLKEVSLQDNLFFLGMLIFGSWGIGQVADATQSIIASACFHLIIQIMTLNALIKNGIYGTEKIIILVIAVGIWYYIIKKWEKRSAPVSS